MKLYNKVTLVMTLALMSGPSAFASPSYPPSPGIDPEYQAVIGFKNGSDSFEKKYSEDLSELKIEKKSRVIVQGYTNPSRNSRSDSKLARERAETVLKKLRSEFPKAKYVVSSEGSRYTALCEKFNNNCVVVTVQQ
jgi:outer membrane protein OmpA-like peptidoglycan-associated protein